MSTQAQIAANRVNSQFSTGPKTAEGKSRVSHNAVKTALTGATILLPSDDTAAYERHLASTSAAWQPAGHREQLLVQSIADTEWRLQRIPALLAGVLALGRIQHAAQFDEHPESIRAALLEAYLEQTCARELRNLSLQESRLRRHREKDIAELEQLQRERRRQRDEQLDKAAVVYQQASAGSRDFNPAEFGFEFSIDEIRQRAAHLQSRETKLKAA